MNSKFQTVFGSLRDYTKGELQIIDDDPKNYAFSNIFDVAIHDDREFIVGSGVPG